MAIDQTISTIGVVGGGQLAMMLAQAGSERQVNVAVQAHSSSDPASEFASKVVCALPQDERGTKDLVDICKAITFENEWINISELHLLESKGAVFVPSISSLAPLVDKLSQRKLLDDLNIPGPLWMPLESKEITPSSLPSGWTFPVMAKATRGGYDGKGTRVLRNQQDLSELIQSQDPKNWFLEEWISYESELALVSSRDSQGIIRNFPLVETKQINQVCDWVLAPAEVEHSVELMAINMASSLLNELDYVGVLAIEFFLGNKGMLVNEIAPRTHNSGHFSIEACKSSQFDQQLCIAAGLDVEDAEMISPGALMVNLLGQEEGASFSLSERVKVLRAEYGSNFHWYGKEFEAPGRKMGHITVLLLEENKALRKEEAKKALKKIRSVWSLNVSL